ncbi:hypothetical protein AWW66_24755 [Micromonospora rosaria]|uniref:DUF308 domain-containing protein n=1 Tax=Micromonospora rosaria TaxID=47874 RepID=A0A136PLL7_9ACTN|nr:hypothetical protein [Micromonospora rosaria]KXK59355.1 hypothetical protein AWW66_24755 [Micromonospora rosaria]
MRTDGYGSPTVVGGGAGELVLMWAGFPVLGAVAGWGLAVGAGFVADLPWFPVQGLFAAIDRLPEPHATIGAVALGALAGLVVALVGTAERLTVTVDVDRCRLRRDGTEQAVPRRGVRAVFRDGKDLVVLGAADEELARERSDLDAGRLEAAFRQHGWPWAAQDPHREAFRRWVPELPGLPVGADALLRARQRAVDRDKGDDARELRAELARLGVVVRDDRKRQYWRLTTTPPPGEGRAPS